MRACEGCRRRKIKCDAATTNTWPCSACIRLKLNCVRPNGFDGAAEAQVYEPPHGHFDAPLQEHQNQQLLAAGPKPPSMYAQQSYQDPGSLYHSVHYTEPQTVAHGLHYAPVHSGLDVPDSRYPTQNAFPTPPLQHSSQAESPEAYQSEYAQQDLADLLGSLKVNEAGTGKRASRLTPTEADLAIQRHISTANYTQRETRSQRSRTRTITRAPCRRSLRVLAREFESHRS